LKYQHGIFRGTQGLVKKEGDPIRAPQLRGLLLYLAVLSRRRRETLLIYSAVPSRRRGNTLPFYSARLSRRRGNTLPFYSAMPSRRRRETIPFYSAVSSRRRGNTLLFYLAVPSRGRREALLLYSARPSRRRGNTPSSTRPCRVEGEEKKLSSPGPWAEKKWDLFSNPTSLRGMITSNKGWRIKGVFCFMRR